jgi:hypothetical protein
MEPTAGSAHSHQHSLPALPASSIHMLKARPRASVIVSTAGSMTSYPNRGFSSKDYEVFKDGWGSLSFTIV